MKVSKAIEILTRFINCEPAEPVATFDKAIKLGIEALKRCQLTEPQASFKLGEPLPGETP